MHERIETVIIGGGQAGLAMSYHLQQLGREHVILERGRIAERWRSERWDSLAFQLPNWMMRLPDYSYDGDDPDGFTHRDGVVRFIEQYARRIAPPIRCGIRVTALEETGTGRLLVRTDHFDLEASNVVVATGPYQEPSIPSFSAALPIRTHQLSASRHTNPYQLPAGSVLVVGSGGSGCQIAEDLHLAGRVVYLSVGRHRRVPRRYRGKDFAWWSEKTGNTERTVDEIPPGFIPPLLTGVNGGHEVDLRRLATEGVFLLGGLRDAHCGRLRFAANLQENLTMGDEGFEQFTRSVDEYILKQSIAAPEEPRPDPIGAVRPAITSASTDLDLKAASISSVIWATGYRYDFCWIKCPVLDARGIPVHKRGVTTVPGLLFLGLPRLYKLKSSFLWGVGEDAAYLAQHISWRRSHDG